MFHRDALFLARLANGTLDEDRGRVELTRLSALFQPVAGRLLAAPAEQQQPIWDEFLAGGVRPEPIGAAEVERRTLMLGAESARRSLALPGSDRARPELRVRMTRAVDVGSREVEWLWAGRVPLGTITMFAGDPKLGKSYVTLAMAASVSRGVPLPMSDLPNRPGSVILMSAEDDPARTIVPRLTAAGADLEKVHILESVILANGSEALPSLQVDIDAITDAATRLGDCRLIVIDPVSAYIRGVDDNRNAALRGVLTPLKALAESLSAAVVLVSHLTKGGSGNGKHRVLGSIAYVGACRANHLFVADPHDPTSRRVLFFDIGGNLAPAAPTLAYVIEDRGAGIRVEWSTEPVEINAGQALRPLAEVPVDEVGRARKCDRWLSAYLNDKPKATLEVFKAASDAGFSRDQVKRAKHRIGAITYRQGFQAGARWTWRLSSASSW